jgi:3-oxoacyl-[acyl-carrier protein] reductase
MDLGIAGKLVLVTGGSRGIGRAVAEAFAAERARTVITYHQDEASALAVAETLGTKPVRYAIGERESADRLMAAVTQEWGEVDILVANALARSPRRLPGRHFEDISPQEWTASTGANAYGAIRLAQLAVGAMRRRQWGRIAFISSHVVHDGQAGQEFYAAGKAALHGLARSLAWDAGAAGVLANVVCPGLTTTDGVLTHLPEAVRQRELLATPTGRLSSPEDIAGAVVFLCSAVNRGITGSHLTIAGGR